MINRTIANLPMNHCKSPLPISSPVKTVHRYLSSQTDSPNEALISDVVLVLTEQRSRSRWNFVKSLYPNGFSPTEVSQITLRIKNNPRLALRFFLWSEEKSLCIHDLLSYSTIIHILARSRLKSAAQALIQKAIRVSESTSPTNPAEPPELFRVLAKTYRLCDSAPFVFDLLINACLQAKKIDRAIKIARMLRSRGISPMTPTCNSLIRSVSQLRGPEDGYEAYKELFGDNVGKVSPNVQTFNTLLLSFYRHQKMGELKVIRLEMEKFGCQPNVFSYCILVAASCDDGKIVEAENLWAEMQSRRIEPDIMAYNTLLKGLCENDKVGGAEELHREMVLREIKPTCVTYEHLIKGHCKIGDVDSALLLYKDMCRKDFRPEASTVDELIEELCRKKRICEGLKVLLDVTRMGGFYPSRKSYVFLIVGLCELGKMEEALKLQADMVGKGFGPDTEIYRAFIGGYIEKGDMDNAKKLETEMLQMGFSATFSTVTIMKR
ncbi:pentatricopeptide repeat-containing protein At2g15980 [Aristolochia californica]|uniref:pentatricopeptide repeat-containing protein At2g15980 n=1 Tax=Aristolochia californica TaxID=171875 RepID=UPI0035DED30E